VASRVAAGLLSWFRLHSHNSCCTFFAFQLQEFWIVFIYLIWLISLGAVGALAFVGMNALSIKDDITFDLTNRRLLLLRVVLGALFAVVLTLPFGFIDFIEFCKSLADPSKSKHGIPEMAKQAILLLLPFVLGFSTSLVILILNQLVEAVQAFFGRKPTEG
jgi:hypothetical protein